MVLVNNTTSPHTFDSVPVLDYNLIRDGNRDEFIKQLRHVLVNVGFLYLANPPIDKELTQKVKSLAPQLFELPQPSKDNLMMRNNQAFYGYNRLGSELTKGAKDQREQFDFGLDFDPDWAPGKPDYLRMWGDAQWPEDGELPGFKSAVTQYMTRCTELGYEFMTLIAEALDLPPNVFDQYYQPSKDRVQHRSKFVKYPPVKSALDGNQGVGPHYDGQFLTLLLQATDDLPGLQAQNLAGQWIDVLPKPDTLVVNFGKGIETVTRGVVLATSHQVISPPVGSPARYSIPWFQLISQEIYLGKMLLDIPQHILALKEARGEQGAIDSINYAEYSTAISGEVALIGRVKSHPDVAARFYPDLFKKYFPNGAPEFGIGY
ncbi:iron/ascorbate oxidoreductase [Clavulina sp. PMI_390]|nr:iron/ascorbate oxidoreductase [Clavulina sp. PMI_390]